MTDLRHPSEREQPVREEYGPNPRRLYSATTLFCDITDSSEVQEFSVSFPIEISLYSAATIIKETMEGDEAELHIGEPTQVAGNTQGVSVGDTIIHVSSTDYFKVGQWASIHDISNSDDLGRVVEIDKDAKTIKVETPAEHNFGPVAAVKVQMKMAHGLKFAGAGAVNFGQAMIGGTPIPANTPICLHYKNNQGAAKKLMLLLEYRY